MRKGKTKENKTHTVLRMVYQLRSTSGWDALSSLRPYSLRNTKQMFPPSVIMPDTGTPASKR
jgi:hypothetical protein